MGEFVALCQHNQSSVTLPAQPDAVAAALAHSYRSGSIYAGAFTQVRAAVFF